MLTLSGISSVRQWLYGWNREDVRRQVDAALFHFGLTSLLCLYSLMLSEPGMPLSLSLVSLLAVVLGFFVIKRDPPRELSRSYLRTDAILER